MFDQSSDLDFVLNDSGIPAVITQPGQPDKPVTILFDQNSLDSMGILTDKPQITIKESDLTGTDIKTATITINNTDYRPTKPLPDGAGLVVAQLTRN